MEPSTVKSSDLAQLYIRSNDRVFTNPSISGLESEGWKVYSPRLIAHTKEKDKTLSEFLEDMKKMKGDWSNIKVTYKEVLVSGRRVGSSEEVEMKDREGKIVRFKAIILVAFGEVGTEEEEKIVELWEIIG